MSERDLARLVPHRRAAYAELNAALADPRDTYSKFLRLSEGARNLLAYSALQQLVRDQGDAERQRREEVAR